MSIQKNIFLICLFFLSQKIFSQTQPDSSKTRDSIKYKNNKGLIFIKADQEAEFPGGAKKWIRYLEKNIDVNIPDKNGAPKGVYTIIANFIVSKDGSVKSVSATTHFGYGMEDELIRVITASPNWKPASQNGKNVNAYRRQSITFRAKN
jgi:protein TonB